MLVDEQFLTTLGINTWKIRQSDIPKKVEIIAQQHGKSIWIYHDINAQIIQDFLSKILSACNFNKAAYTIKLSGINGIYTKPCEVNFINIDYYVIFDIQRKQIPWISINNTKHIIELPSLNNLHGNIEMKKQAWQKLKIINSL